MAIPANVFAPNGFVPFAPGGGAAPPTFALRPMQIAFNNATAIFKGDPVKMLSTGFVAQWTAATGVSQLAGIFWGCEYLSTTRGYVVSPFWPASGDVLSTNIVRAYVYPCDLATPMWFLVQSDASTGVVQGNVGNNIDVALGSGSTVTGVSGASINSGTIGTANTLPFKIMRLYGEGAGTAFGIGGLDNGAGAAPANKVYVAANITSSTGI
jgi:hypothetical protein